MKKSKKLMLLSIGAMSAVAVATGAVSTMAWYQANARTGQVKSVSDIGSVTVSDPQYSASTVDLPLNVRVATDSSKTLELAHYFEEDALVGQKDPDGQAITDNAAGLYRAWYKTASTSSIVYDDQPKDAGYELTRVYTIYAQVAFPGTEGLPTVEPTTGLPCYWNNNGTVNWRDANLNDWTEAQVITELNGKVAKFDVAQKDANCRAKFYGAGTSSTPAVADGATSVTNASCVALATIGSEMAIGYFGYYVEGVNGDTIDTANINGNFTVTVHA